MAGMRYVVIMAGGSGTRLWPLSRRGTPKQLLPLIEGRSLLRLAFVRALQLVDAERVLVVTGAAYLDDVRRDLPELPEANLLGEPEGRDSLNAVAWPAAVLAERDPDAVIAQLTADQIIEPTSAFVTAVARAYEVAEARDAIVTLGVVPTSAHTGYGYLRRGEELSERGAWQVREFREKPDAATAAGYVTSGEYWWIAGMFVFRAGVFLDQLRLLEPDTYAAVRRLAQHPDELETIFPALRRISVDYAVMEPVGRGEGSAIVAAVPLPISWRDVGGFASLAEVLPADADDNVTSGATLAMEAHHNLVLNEADGHLVTVLGVSDLVVVHTADATLVTTLEHAEKIKALVGRVADEAGPSYV